jgi:uncharacterized protein YecT (DUF1311 family)
MHMSEQGNSPPNSNAQIWLAIIGLIGALGGTIITNWDKLFPKPVVPAPTLASTLTAAPPEIKVDTAPVPKEPGKVRQEAQPVMPAVGPSFDCAKARHLSERLICSSPELAVLDLALANAYRDAVARVGTRERKADLRNLQARWLRTTREACADVACLRDLYERRIRELNEVAAP